MYKFGKLFSLYFVSNTHYKIFERIFLKLQQKLILKIKLHNMCKISLYTRIEKNNSM